MERLGTRDPLHVDPPGLDQRCSGGRPAVVAALLLTLVVAAAACSTRDGSTDVGRARSDHAPVERAIGVDYSATDQSTGRRVSMADLRGRPALLASWATWCVPCRKELPALERFHRTLGGDGLQVVVVNLDSKGMDDAVDEMVDRYDLTMTRWRDDTDAFTIAFRGLGIPMSVLVDRSGVVVHTWYGALDPDDPEVRSVLAKVAD